MVRRSIREDQLGKWLKLEGKPEGDRPPANLTREDQLIGTVAKLRNQRKSLDEHVERLTDRLRALEDELESTRDEREQLKARVYELEQDQGLTGPGAEA